MSETETIRVDLGERGYDIVVGDGVLARAGELLAPVLSQNRVIVVTDRNVAKLHLETLQRALDDKGVGHEEIVLEAGEQTKRFADLEKLLDDLLGRGIERRHGRVDRLRTLDPIGQSLLAGKRRKVGQP